MIKLRAPEGATVSRPFVLGEEGSVEVPEGDAPTLLAHGFTLWDDKGGASPLGNIEEMTRPQLIEAAIVKARLELDEISTEEIRSVLRSGPLAPDNNSISGTIDKDDPEEVRIAALDRNGLFGYLKAEGVSAPPPIANDKLREIALKTHRDKRSA